MSKTKEELKHVESKNESIKNDKRYRFCCINIKSNISQRIYSNFGEKKKKISNRFKYLNISIFVII